MKDFAKRLGSRKFLLVVSAAAAAAASGEWTAVVTIVLAYLGVNAVVTAKAPTP